MKHTRTHARTHARTHTHQNLTLKERQTDRYRDTEHRDTDRHRETERKRERQTRDREISALIVGTRGICHRDVLPDVLDS